jgi:hypothetical protein
MTVRRSLRNGKWIDYYSPWENMYTTKLSRQVDISQLCAKSTILFIRIVVVVVGQFILMTTISSGFQLQYTNNQFSISTMPFRSSQNKFDAERMSCNHFIRQNKRNVVIVHLSSDDWSTFQVLDDDDEIVYGKVLDKQQYAEENDPQSVKESIGALHSAPIIDCDAIPISVPAGTEF